MKKIRVKTEPIAKTDRSSNDCIAALHRGKVCDDRGDEIVTGIVSRALQRVLVDVRKNELRARGTKLQHQLSTEAAAGTGDQDCFVGRICHR